MAWLHLLDGKRQELIGQSVTVGRDAGNDIVLADDRKASRIHAEMRLVGRQWTLRDLGSSNGTWVNDRRIDHEHPLRGGDRIEVGHTVLTFFAGEDPNATEADDRSLVIQPELTDRERQVLALLASGLTDREIGERLFISTSTVRSHLDRIGDKTGLRRRAELTRMAIEFGIGSEE